MTEELLDYLINRIADLDAIAKGPWYGENFNEIDSAKQRRDELQDLLDKFTTV